jgi:hypothetical protein
LTNLYDAINLDSASSGTAYAASTFRNDDFRAIGVTATTLILRNVMDGTNAYGWPAAMQNGVLTIQRYTNSGVVLYPCYQWSNTVHMADGDAWSSMNWFNNNCGGTPDYVSQLLVEGRDLFNNVRAPYTPLAYPHRLQAMEGGGGANGGAKLTQPAPPNNLITLTNFGI